MKALVMLFARNVYSEDNHDYIERTFEAGVTGGFPAEHNMWVYCQILAEQREEGLPFDMALDLISPVDLPHRIYAGTPIMPLRKHPDIPVIFRPKFDCTIPLTRAGLHYVRLTVGDDVLAERPLPIIHSSTSTSN